MSVCASPNVVSILIVHRYMLLTSAVNQFGKREREPSRTIWFIQSCAMEVAGHLRNRFALRPLWCCTNTERYKVVRTGFHEIDWWETINIGVCTWYIRQTYVQTNIRNSLVDLFRSSQVAKYAINFDQHLVNLDSVCKV